VKNIFPLKIHKFWFAGFNPEAGGDKLLRNFGFSQNDTAL
jgi:hypothetical protein